MESLSHGVFGFRSRADVAAYVTHMNEDAASVSWTKSASIPFLADAALKADDLLQDGEATVNEIASARETRRIALDELVRRGAIEPYRLI